MLAEHRIDIERAADVVGRIDGADLDMRFVARGENGAQVVRGDRKHVAAGDRIAGDAAAEIAELAARILDAFAEEIDVRDEIAAVVGAQRADVGNQPGVADDHLDLASDLARHRDRRVGVRLQRPQRGSVHADLRARTGDFDNLSDCGGRGALALHWRSRHFIREVADFVDEFVQVGLFVHGLLHSGHCDVPGDTQKRLKLA